LVGVPVDRHRERDDSVDLGRTACLVEPPPAAEYAHLVRDAEKTARAKLDAHAFRDRFRG
jgi:hypothetical protein